MTVSTLPPVAASLAPAVEAIVMARDGKHVGTEIVFRCALPGHEDGHPSARWNPAKGTWFCDVCKRGGGALDLARLLGVPPPDRPAPSRPSRTVIRPRIVRTFDYRDAGCQVLFQVCRLEPGRNGRRKDFMPRHRCATDRNGSAGDGWTWGMGGEPGKCACPKIPPVPYRLPDLLDPARADEDLFIPEGEAKADALAEMGFLATSAPGGTGKFTRELAERLKGHKRVVILPDADGPGRRGTYATAQNVRAANPEAEIKIVELPGLPPKGDILNWLDAGTSAEPHDAAALRKIVEAAPVWTGAEAEATPPLLDTVDAVALVTNPPPAPESFLDPPGLADAGESVFLAGPPGSGKSLLMVNLGCAVATGKPFFALRLKGREPRRVLLLLAEYSRYRAYVRLRRVIERFGVQPGQVEVWTRDRAPCFLDLATADTSGAQPVAEELADYVRRGGFGIIGIDSISEVHVEDENDRAAMSRVTRALRMIGDAGALVAPIHHERKPPPGARNRNETPTLADVRGSGAIVAAAASVLQCRKEAPDETTAASFFAVWTKHNYADPDPRAFRFRLDDPASGVITSLDAALHAGRPKKVADADFLTALRAEGGERVQTEVVANRTGVSTKTAGRRLKELAEGGRIERLAGGFWALCDADDGPAGA